MLSTIDEYLKADLTHEVHTSERRSFRACRRRWDWLFRESYYPLVTAKPLEFGVAYHAAMEVLYDPKTWGILPQDNIREAAIATFKATCEEQRRKALDYAGALMLDVDVETDYDERVALGVGMIDYYATHVAPQLDVGWKPVRVEVGFKVPVPHPDKPEQTILCTCDLCWKKFTDYLGSEDDDGKFGPDFQEWARELLDAMEQGTFGQDNWSGLPVVYAGRCDMIAQDERGGLWIFDWKTARAIPDNHDFLDLDDQISSYVWALNRLGLNIRGFVYHEQRKGYPLPPRRNKTRRLGRLFSVAENQDTDYDIYLCTIMNEDADAFEEGLYDNFLHWLDNDGPTYYSREKRIKTWDELEQIQYNIGLEVLDMIDPKLRIYPSAGRFGCQFCAFQTPCIEKNVKGDYQYALDTLFERREHYYVRQEASTESKGGE